jgi:hypothetical protein
MRRPGQAAWLMVSIASVAPVSAVDVLGVTPSDVLHGIQATFEYLFSSAQGLLVFVALGGCTGFCMIPYVLKCWLQSSMGADKIYPGGGIRKAFGMV